MVTTRKLLIAVLVGAAAVLAAASTSTNATERTDRHDAATLTPSAAHAPDLPPTAAATSPSATRNMRARPSQPVRSHKTPSAHGAFSIGITTRSGEISAQVDPISVASNEPVDPPHSTPAEWNTAVWVKQSSYPAARSHGTSYVYGHACHYHLCPFTRLKDVTVGDHVTVTTAAGTLTYRIGRVGLSPKTARSLPSWASDSSVPNRLVLVTCAYEQGDTSTDNIVVMARLQSA